MSCSLIGDRSLLITTWIITTERFFLVVRVTCTQQFCGLAARDFAEGSTGIAKARPRGHRTAEICDFISRVPSEGWHMRAGSVSRLSPCCARNFSGLIAGACDAGVGQGGPVRSRDSPCCVHPCPFFSEPTPCGVGTHSHVHSRSVWKRTERSACPSESSRFSSRVEWLVREPSPAACH